MGQLIGVGSLVDWVEVGKLAARLAVDLVFAAIVIQVVYLRVHGRRDHAFTCYLFNVVTLCLCVLLRKGPAELGFALTLFGVFGILRYRTEQIRSRDLTYLFILIGLGIINGVASREVSVAELFLANAVIAGFTAGLELGRRGHVEQSMPLCYDRLDLLHPGHEASLFADLRSRTGLAIVRVETERIDCLRDAAEITIHFRRAPVA